MAEKIKEETTEAMCANCGAKQGETVKILMRSGSLFFCNDECEREYGKALYAEHQRRQKTQQEL